MKSENISTGSTNFPVSYDYVPRINGSSTTKLNTISNNGNSVSYTYDANGNIETITQNGEVVKYTYNELNELVREDNGVLNKTIVYSYDAG